MAIILSNFQEAQGESILKLRKQKLKQKEKLKESIWHLYLSKSISKKEKRP